MKITKEKLDRMALKQTGQILCVHHESEPMDSISMVELLRLARLGLWAEKHGIPALELYGDPLNWEDRSPYVSTPCIFKPSDSVGWGASGKLARTAIVALPSPRTDPTPS